jgi:hypothetical protein
MKEHHLVRKVLVGLFVTLGAIGVFLVVAALFTLAAPAFAHDLDPAAPPPPAVVQKTAPPHHAAAKHVPQWHVMPAQQPMPAPEWGLGSWFAAPFNAAGTVIGTVAGGVANVVETPFIAVGQAWSNENCWQHMVDPHDGQIKLFWICK